MKIRFLYHFILTMLLLIFLLPCYRQTIKEQYQYLYKADSLEKKEIWLRQNFII